MSVKLAVTGAASALVVGAVTVLGVTAAADEPTEPAAASAPASPELDVDRPATGAPEGLGDHGDVFAQLDRLREVFADLPAELRQDLTRAAQDGDPGERLTALADVHDRAARGEYGAEVRDQAEQLDADLPSQADLEELMADHLGALPIDVPAELQDDLAVAAGNGDAGDRLTALADLHDRALAGDYGPEVQRMVRRLGALLDEMGGPGAPTMMPGFAA